MPNASESRGKNLSEVDLRLWAKISLCYLFDILYTQQPAIFLGVLRYPAWTKGIIFIIDLLVSSFLH